MSAGPSASRSVPSAEFIKAWRTLADATAVIRNDDDERRTRGTLQIAQAGEAAHDRARDPLKSRGLVRSGDRNGTEEIFGFMKSRQAKYRIAMLCRTLEISASGYYAWSTRPPSVRDISDMLLGDRIEALWRESRETYGHPRIQADLIDEGIHVSDKRVARLMKERNIHGASRHKGFKTTTSVVPIGGQHGGQGS
jgi:hypothetical protein